MVASVARNIDSPDASQLDVFEASTWMLTNTDYTLDDNDLAKRCPLDDSSGRGPGKQNLGVLDRLPLELLHLVLADLDLRTLTDFRTVNRRASWVLDSFPQYAVVKKLAPNVLRGILSIRTGPWITCSMLYNTMISPCCQTCGDFGGYIYLITCKRVCFLCFTDSEQWLPLGYGIAKRRFSISYKVLDTLPHMKSRPGTYSSMARLCRKDFRLVDFQSVRDYWLANLRRASRRNHEAQGDKVSVDESIPVGVLSTKGQISRVGVGNRAELPFDGKPGNPLRFMAVVEAPQLTLQSGTFGVEPGVYCLACSRSSIGRPCHFRRRFTRSTFPAHLQECHLSTQD